METLSLARRKSQLELLARACGSRQSARVALRPAAPETPGMQTRFLALESEGILLEWPPHTLGAIAASGAPVDVFFEHDEERFRFATETRGRAWWSHGSRSRVAAWKLGLPLRIDRQQQREDNRVSLAHLAPVTARCTSVAQPQISFTAELRNISAGDLSATALTQAPVLRPGALFWTTFELPGQKNAFEFVVRLAHVHQDERAKRFTFGATFCPGEDPLQHRAQLRRIEQLVAQCGRVRLCRAAQRSPEGT